MNRKPPLTSVNAAKSPQANQQRLTAQTESETEPIFRWVTRRGSAQQSASGAGFGEPSFRRAGE